MGPDAIIAGVAQEIGRVVVLLVLATALVAGSLAFVAGRYTAKTASEKPEVIVAEVCEGCGRAWIAFGPGMDEPITACPDCGLAAKS